MSEVSSQGPTLEAIPALVEEQLRVFFDGQESVVAEIGAPVEDAVSYLRKFVLGGGKRIRPLYGLSLIHISEPTRQCCTSRMPSSA